MKYAIARVINSAEDQIILLPGEFWLEADEVRITQSGDRIILTPRMRTWEGFAEGLSGFSDDFAVTGRFDG